MSPSREKMLDESGVLGISVCNFHQIGDFQGHSQGFDPSAHKWRKSYTKCLQN